MIEELKKVFQGKTKLEVLKAFKQALKEQYGSTTTDLGSLLKERDHFLMCAEAQVDYMPNNEALATTFLKDLGKGRLAIAWKATGWDKEEVLISLFGIEGAKKAATSTTSYKLPSTVEPDQGLLQQFRTKHTTGDLLTDVVNWNTKHPVYAVSVEKGAKLHLASPLQTNSKLREFLYKQDKYTVSFDHKIMTCFKIYCLLRTPGWRPETKEEILLVKALTRTYGKHTKFSQEAMLDFSRIRFFATADASKYGVNWDDRAEEETLRLFHELIDKFPEYVGEEIPFQKVEDFLEGNEEPLFGDQLLTETSYAEHWNTLSKPEKVSLVLEVETINPPTFNTIVTTKPDTAEDSEDIYD